MTHLWKTGVFTNGAYEGQDLVTAQMDCDGPCNAEIFRFTFDEKSNRWTLLSKYSSEAVSMIYIPFDLTDSTTVFQEFEVPKSLKVWENNVAVLKNEFAMLMTEESKGAEIVTLDDPSFASYQLISGCIYGFTGDSVGVMYSLAPTEFLDPSSGIVGTQKLTFTDMKGAQSTKEFTIDQGGCRLAASCILTQAPLDSEEAKLEKIGSIGDNDALMFASIDADSTAVDGLEGAAVSAYQQYKMQLEYTGGAAMSLSDFASSGNIFFIKMGTGKYVLVRDSKYQQTAECGTKCIKF